MELREFAEQVLKSPTCMEKIQPIRESLTDQNPGLAEKLTLPAREEKLTFGARRTAPPMPAIPRFSEPAQRAIAHHIMANHELQALEVMAWVLLAFPEAPTEFRLGAGRSHERRTAAHPHAHGTLQSSRIEFGSLPVNSYIWRAGHDLHFRDGLSGWAPFDI